MGGPQKTEDKNAKRRPLIGQLRQLSASVQIRRENSHADLLPRGFETVCSYTASSPTGPPSIKDINNGISSQQILHVSRIKNAKIHEVC